MNYSLKAPTPSEWARAALSNFNAFLLDHAACERKACAVGLSFVVRYPDRTALMDPMIQFAREELEHFHQVFRLIEERGLILERDEEDKYVNLLLGEVRFGRDERFLDRLLVSSIIEARGFERLTLITEVLEDTALKSFYLRLTRAEKRHTDLFLEMAELYFSPSIVEERLHEFIEVEAKAILSVPYRCALH